MATTIYTFTPTAGQCATGQTMTINVNTSLTPTFTQVAAICSGATLSALPTTSSNGITGTWSPALNNLATTTYTFTPNAGQCATSQIMTITVNPSLTPTFTQVAAICSGATLSALPNTSTNGISGSWSPAMNNLATTTYTFTPNAGQCATNQTMTITVNPSITPTFTQVAAICSGTTLSALPTSSSNGITGTWSPALNNLATTTYTFTPTDGQCATSQIMTITVNPSLTPTFTQVAAICSGATLSALPTTSSNGITGTWSPALNNLATTTYTFTPNAGQCATNKTMTITVIPFPQIYLNNAVLCISAINGTVINYTILNTNLSTSQFTFQWYRNDVLLSNENSNQLVVSQIGQYYVTYQNTASGCTSNSTISNVSEVLTVQNFIIGQNNDDFSENETIIIEPFDAENNWTYTLDYGTPQLSNIFTSVQYGIHTITIFDPMGCVDYTEAFIVSGYPKYFTPNNDGYNDTWNVYGFDKAAQVSTVIFDRYGKLLKELKPDEAGWDGNYNNNPLPSTDYWFVTYYTINGIKKEFKSHFSLKR